jgi:4-hydroxy-3-methylbut-2-enyl diphosphate reductase
VVRIVSFGAFVELEPGLDGLVHISQIADHRIEKVEDALKVGQEVNVKILSINPEQRRISLSIRDAVGMGSGEYEEETEYDSSLMYSTAGEEKE